MKARAFAVSLISAVLVDCASRPSAPSATEAEGEALAAGVHAAIQEHSVPIHHCYEKELKARPSLGAGRVVLEWDIAPSGGVSRIVMKESFDQAVDNCLIDVVQEIKFQPTTSGNYGRITYPFDFKP